MYKAVILPLAKEDIRNSAKWYNEKQKDLGKRFTSEIREKVYFVRQNPQTGNIRYNNVRIIVLNIFPFMIHYILDDHNKAIVISAVLHTSRNPELWAER